MQGSKPLTEIGIESSILQDILRGTKTVEGRLGKPKFLKIRKGDILSIREDFWQDGAIARSISNRAFIRVTQKLYFISFEEMLSSVGIAAVLPAATDMTDALRAWRQFYSEADEQEYGVVALMFELHG
jgi:ASC-1-like (ASCH) protein